MTYSRKGAVLGIDAENQESSPQQTPAMRALEDRPVNRKVVLSGLWVAMLFLYAYVDIFSFFRADVLNGALQGRVSVADVAIDQQFLVLATVYILIPALMVVASLLLPARLNRWVNIAVSAVYAASVVSLAVGDPWAYYVLGSVAEVVLLVAIAWLAWTWPRTAQAVGR
ncbi:MAG: DUF6326 family protein [Propionicimonas sp.]